MSTLSETITTPSIIPMFKDLNNWEKTDAYEAIIAHYERQQDLIKEAIQTIMAAPTLQDVGRVSYLLNKGLQNTEILIEGVVTDFTGETKTQTIDTTDMRQGEFGC